VKEEFVKLYLFEATALEYVVIRSFKDVSGFKENY
jgi:hypothetical protein